MTRNMYRLSQEERRYSVPFGQNAVIVAPATCEDLHAWSIYRQNLNSDFTDSALGSSDKSPLPYGNFKLRDTTVQTILSHPRYGPQSPLGTNMYTYLKFGLPRVFPQQNDSSNFDPQERQRMPFSDMEFQIESSDYDSSENEISSPKLYSPKHIRRFRSEPDFQVLHAQGTQKHSSQKKFSKTKDYSETIDLHEIHLGQRSQSEANLFNIGKRRGQINSIRKLPAEEHENELFPKAFQQETYTFPILQVRKLSKNKHFSDITFKVCANDLFAVMATSVVEGTLILKILAGLRSKTSGQIIVNGNDMSANMLRKLCAYVSSANESPFDPEMDVQSTLKFYGSLRSFKNASTKKKLVSKTKGRF